MKMLPDVYWVSKLWHMLSNQGFQSVTQSSLDVKSLSQLVVNFQKTDRSPVTLISDLISLIMISKFLPKNFIKIDQNQILMFKYAPDMKSYESKMSQTKSVSESTVVTI